MMRKRAFQLGMPAALATTLAAFFLACGSSEPRIHPTREEVLGDWSLVALSKEPLAQVKTTTEVITGHALFNQDGTYAGEFAWPEFPDRQPNKITGTFTLESGVLRVLPDGQDTLELTSELFLHGEYLVMKPMNGNSFWYYYKRIKGGQTPSSSFSGTTKYKEAEAVASCRRIRLGMTRAEVLEIMPEPVGRISYKKNRKEKEKLVFPSRADASTPPQLVIDRKTGRVEEVVCDANYRLTQK